MNPLLIIFRAAERIWSGQRAVRREPSPPRRFAKLHTSAGPSSHWAAITVALWAIILCASLNPGAHAQDSDTGPTIHLPPWIIEAPAEGALPPTLAHGITVVGARESAFHPYTTLRNALGTLPGLILQDSFGGFDPPRISVRGSGLQSAPVTRGIVQRLDGLPLNLADGSFNSALLEPALASLFATRRASVDPIAAVNALGGTLELGTRREAPTARVFANAGNFGLRRVIAEGGWAGGSSAAWAGLSHTRSDGFRENHDQDRTVLAANLHHRAGDHLKIGFNLFAANPHLSVPGPLAQTAALENPESILPVVAQDKPRRETDVVRLAINSTWQLADTSVRAAAGLQQTSDYFRQLRANGTSDSTSDDLTMSLEARHRTGPHELRGGVYGAFGGRSLTRFINNTGADGAIFADLLLRAENIAVWIEDTAQLHENLTLQGGVSVSRYKRRASPAAGAPAGTPAGSVDDAFLAPRIHLTWTPRPGIAVFGGWSRAYEPPTFDDLLARQGRHPNLRLAFNPLEAQRADTFEVGVRGGGERIRYEVTLYHAGWRRELLRLADAQGSPLGTRNAGPTTHRGIESSLRWRILEEQQTLDLILSHTWSEATFDDDPFFGDNRLAGLPRHAGAGEIQFADRRGPFAALGAAWIGGTTFADHANRLGYEGHIIVNARCGWRDPRGWTVYLEAGNLLDKNYIASTAGVLDIARNPPATTVFLPGSPRTWNVGFEWRW